MVRSSRDGWDGWEGFTTAMTDPRGGQKVSGQIRTENRPFWKKQ